VPFDKFWAQQEVRPMYDWTAELLA